MLEREQMKMKRDRAEWQEEKEREEERERLEKQQWLENKQESKRYTFQNASIRTDRPRVR